MSEPQPAQDESPADSSPPPPMAIEAIYTYPIKSLRGTALSTALITPTGPPFDRRFFLVRDHGPSAPTRYKTLHVAEYPSLVLFTTALLDTSGNPTTDAAVAHTLRVRHTPPPTSNRSSSERTLPLRPDVSAAPRLPVTMHQSAAVARAMPPALSAWFSDILGFPAVLAYHPESSEGRRVLGNVAPGAAARNAAARLRTGSKRKRSPRDDAGARPGWSASWIGGVLARAAGLRGPDGLDVDGDEDGGDGGFRISYADCAALLVVSAASAAEVQRRVDALNAAGAGDGRAPTVMDVTKFRPNVVVGGAGEAWAEDFWGVLAVSASSPAVAAGADGTGGTDGTDGTKDTDDTGSTKGTVGGADADSTDGTIHLDLTTNCVRCPSLNVDYATGAASGRMLQTLQRDRRVDRANKWNPVFGRYAFLRGGRAAEVRVGDRVRVAAANEARCDLKWPGIGGTDKDEWYPE